MIIKFASKYTIEKDLDVTLMVKQMTVSGPHMINYNGGFNHGIVALYENFHKMNTPIEQVEQDLKTYGGL